MASITGRFFQKSTVMESWHTDEEAAEMLNNFFQSVFLQGEAPEFPEQVEPNKALYTIDITPSDVHNQLFTLDKAKAAGPESGFTNFRF